MSEKRCAPVIIASDNDLFRTRMEAEIRAEGIEPVAVGDAGEVWRVPPAVVDEAIVVLETNDDVAKLVQTANDLYWSPFHRIGAATAMCVVSRHVLEQNQALGWWLIDGHAAVLTTSPRELTGAEVIVMARRFARVLEKRSGADDKNLLDRVFDRILERATDADAWMAAYDLVIGANGLGMAMAREETGAALARQAVKLAPEDDTAWTRLAEALHYSGRYEETAEAARRAIRLNPDGARAHMRLGEALDRLGNREEARSEMEKALTLAGDDVGLKRWVTMRLEAFDPENGTAGQRSAHPEGQ